MILKALQSVGALIAGSIVAFLLVISVELISMYFYPFPEGVDPSDMEVCKAQVESCPHWVLGIAVVGWGATAFTGPWVATRLGANRHPAHGAIIGLLLLAAVGFNMAMLPYAQWFVIANILIVPLAIFWGIQLGRKKAEPLHDEDK